MKPPDLLWVEWFSGKSTHTTANKRRPMAVYKYNLLEHMGKVSSFTVRVDRPDFPKCYESMADVWSLSRAERFQVRLPDLKRSFKDMNTESCHRVMSNMDLTVSC